MKKIREFSKGIDKNKFLAILYDTKLVSFFENEKEATYLEEALDSVIEKTTVIISRKIDIQIFKEVAKLLKHKNLPFKTRKYRDFWSSINTEKIKIEDVYLPQGVVWRKTQISVSAGNIYNDIFSPIYEQALSDFFFHGPTQPEIPLKFRRKFRQDIFNSLDKSKTKLRISDGFPLFNYAKIKKFDLKIDKGNSGHYLYLNKGKITVGSWKDKPTSYGLTYSIEDLWHYPQFIVPEVFKDKIPKIKEILEHAIISEKSKDVFFSQPPDSVAHS